MIASEAAARIWPSGSRDWDANRWKAHLEKQICERLDAIEQDSIRLSDWQKEKLRWAIACTARGLYPLAASELFESLSRMGEAEDPWPEPRLKPLDLEQLNLEAFRRALDWLKQQPTQEMPIFG
jgi:hypothetical protein